MRRKLIKHGDSSLLVSLPAKWVKENNLQKGEEIEVEEGPGKVIISTEKHYQKNVKELDVSNSRQMIKRMVGACYKSGYNEARITFSSAAELNAINTVVREQFNGFEIINQEKNSLRVKNLSEISFDEFPNALRRFFLLFLQVFDDNSRAISSEDFEWLKQNSFLKKDADKFADYCRRAINMGYAPRFGRIAPLYTIIEQLEKTIDRYKEIGDHICERRTKIGKELKEFCNELAEFCRSFYEAFYSFDQKRIIMIGDQKGKLQKKIDKILLGTKGDESIIASKLNQILNTIFDLNGPLMAVYF
jgi:phosphate uptake regulator